MVGIKHKEGIITVRSDHRVSAALAEVGTRLTGIAAGALGLMLALGIAGLAGLLPFDAVAGALGFVAGGGLIIGRAVVADALGRTGALSAAES